MTIRAFKNITPSIAQHAYVDEDSVVIGNVQIGEHSSIWPGTVIRGDVNNICIGDRTNVQDGSMLHVTAPSSDNPDGFPLSIGNDVTVGHGAILHACTIEDECLVGMGATILDGAILKKNVFLAAGSLVPPGKILDGGYLWVGNPARRVRELTEKELQFFSKSAKNYVVLKAIYLNEME